ncbi:MAG: accessory gene regulator B family protein [Lachnospiraceae bacterium]
METIAYKIVKYLGDDQDYWNDIERMHMMLGIQILLHNAIMLGTILFVAKIIGILIEASILLLAYGIVKTSAGGIHFKKSSSCLIGTGTFVGVGVWISRQLNIILCHIIIIYIICLIILIIVGPQGTENNPISEKHYKKLKKRTIFWILSYMFTTVIADIMIRRIPYLLFIAVVFETLSLFPPYIKKRGMD